MTSFGYRLNPRYAIKECLSRGALYTHNCSCSKGNIEDKILVPKPPKICARCAKCGYLVDGPNCQGCALLRQELEENLVTHSSDFQNISEPSNVSTNVVNAPREPYVVKQDNGRFLNDSPSISETSSQSPPNIDHCCYECGDPLDGIFCKQCTCKSCGKGAHIGYNCQPKVLIIPNPEPCNNQTIDELPQALPIFHPTFHSEAESPFTLDSTPTYVDESPNIPACCDDDDDDDSAITHILSTKEPIDSLSMGDEHLDTIPATESDEVIKSSVEDLVPIPSEFEGIPDTMCDVHLDNNHTPLEAKDHVEIVTNSNDDISSSDDDSLHEENIEYVEASPYDSKLVSLEVAEIVIPEVEEIEDDNLREKLLNEPVDSLSMGDEHLDTILATESDEVIKSSVDDLISIPSEFEGIPDTMCDVHLDNNHTPLEAKDHVEASPHDSELVNLVVAEIVILEVEEIEEDNLRENLLNVHLLIANIEALKDNPTQSFEFLTKSSSTSLNSFLKETNTFHNSLPEFENFFFDLGEIGSGSTTTHCDISFPDYEAFYFDDDHIKEISSGSTTTHSDISLSEYDSFIFEEFVDELAHIISPPEYDCFYFKDLPYQ
nr:hypothetical protein [Tanacetum cinerariifolium]